MLPDFLDMKVDEIHIEMANREFAEIELLAAFAEKMDVSVGIIDVKMSCLRTQRQAFCCTRLRTEPNSKMGFQTKVDQHG